MFRVTGTKSTNAGSLEFKDCGVEFIGRTSVNNGVQGYIDGLDYVPNEEGTITVSQVGTIVAQYRGSSYYTSQNIAKLDYNRKLSKEEGMYLVTSINKHLQIYGGYQTPKLDDIKNIILELPVLTPEDTTPYWDYMAYYIHNIQQQYADQLEAKSEYEINLMCQILGVTRDDIVQRLEFTQPQYTNTFKVGDLFVINRGDISNQGNLVETGVKEGVSFIAQNDSNNGYVKQVESESYKVFKGRNIVIGRQTGAVYYQDEEFVTTDGVLVLRSKQIIDKEIGLYLVTIIKKHLENSGYTNTVSATKLNKIELELPVIAPNSKQIDWGAIRHVIIRKESTIWLLVKRYATEVLR